MPSPSGARIGSRLSAIVLVVVAAAAARADGAQPAPTPTPAPAPAPAPDPAPTPAPSPAAGAAGGACYGNGTCDAGLACDASARTCLPVAAGAEGGACYGNDTCDAGLACDPATRRCVRAASAAAGAEGGPCYGNGTCNAGLACDAAAGRCVLHPAGTKGGACYGNGTCDAGLACAAGRCASGAPSGASDGPTTPAGTGATGAAGATGADGAAGADGATGASPVGPYPARLIDRPLTLPRGLIQVGSELHGMTYREVDSSLRESASVSILGSYGINATLEARAEARLRISPSPDEPPALTLGGRVRALRTARVELAPQVDARLDFGGGLPLGFVALSAGLQVRLAPWLALRAGDNLVWAHTADPEALGLDLDLAAVLQPHRALALVLWTQPASVTALGTGGRFWYGDRVPAGITAVVTPLGSLDVVARVLVLDLGDSRAFLGGDLGIALRL